LNAIRLPAAVAAAVMLVLSAGCSKDVHYYIEMGNEAVREGDFRQAVLHFEKAVELYPESYEAHNSLGAALSASGNLERAVEHFSIAVALKNDFVEGYYNLGRALAGLGRFDEAVEQYEKAVAVDSTYAIAYMGLADAYLGAGDPGRAARSYGQAIEYDRTLLKAYIGLGSVYVGQQEYQKAIDTILAARRVFPKNADLPFMAGKASILMGDPDLAVEHLTEAVALDSLNLFYRNDLASAYMLAGRRMDAIAEWEGILARNPGLELRDVVEANLERAATEE